MITRDPGAPFDTPNVVIGRQGHNELTLSFRPLPYLSTLLYIYNSELISAMGRGVYCMQRAGGRPAWLRGSPLYRPNRQHHAGLRPR